MKSYFRFILFSTSIFNGFAINAQFSPLSCGIIGTGNAKVAWADYDNDNDLDVAVWGDTVSTSTKRLIFYTNNSGSFSLDTSFTINNSEVHIEWGDYDNDNDPDLLFGGTTVRIFINNGGTFNMIYPLGISFYPRSDIHWGDFNNDGRKDILEGNVVYYNSGNGFTAGQFQNIYFDLAASAVADYDADGDLDFIISGDTAFPGYVTLTSIYRNNGDSTFTLLSPVAFGTAGGAIAWSDFDEDGDLDFSICGNNTNGVNIFNIYRNNSGTFTDMNAGLTPISSSSLSWGDYNNDGFPDIAYCGLSVSSIFEAKILINNGGTSFTDVGAGLVNYAFGDISWADYDNDSDLDLLTVGRNSSIKLATVYVNNYNIFNSVPTSPVGLSSSSSLNEVQLNWQAASDLQSTSTSLTYEIYLLCPTCNTFNVTPLCDTTNGWKKIPSYGNLGQVNTTKVKNLPCGLYRWKVQAIDAGYEGSSFSMQDTFSINYPLPPFLLQPANHSIGNLLNPTFVWNPSYGATTYHIQVATDSLFQNLALNDSQFTATNYFSSNFNFFTNYYWRIRANHGNYIGDWSNVGTFKTKANVDVVEISSALIPMSNGRITWIDFDNDNDLDIICAGDTVGPTGARKIKFFKNNNGAFSFYPEPGLAGSLTFMPEVDFADIDSDGDLDLALQGPGNSILGYIVLYINNNGDFTPSPQVFPRMQYGDISWCDYDHDGDPDLLGTGRDGSLLPVTKLFNNQNGVFSDAGFQFTDFSYSQTHWVDIDNDGYEDLVFTGDTTATSTGRVTRYYKNNQGMLFSLGNINIQSFLFSTCTYATADAGGASWADFDGDGDIDLVASGDTIITSAFLPFQSVRIYRNNGGILSLFQVLTDSLRGNVRWGDINNDGKPDIVISGSRFTYSQFKIAIWLNTGSTFVPYTPLLPDVAKGDVSLGDYDNDNDLDIVVMGADSITARLSTLLFRNDSPIPNTAPSPPTALSYFLTGSSALLSWNAGTDVETPAAGLSYSIAVGNLPNSLNIMAPSSDLQTGRRRTSTIGNTGYKTSFRITNLAQGWHYWQVQSIDASYIGSAFSPIDSFYVNIPGIPILIAPANNATQVPLQLTFVWMSSNSAISYQLEIAADTFFTQILFNNATLTDTFLNYNISSSVTEIYWRVKAFNNYGSSAWSEIWTAKTINPFVLTDTLSWGYGPSFADYDNDGDLDILILACVTCPDSIKLWRNDSGQFSNVPIPGLPAQLGGGGARWADYDNDGDADLLLFGGTINPSPYNPITAVYQNNNGIFTDINAGLMGVIQGDVRWVDYDNDGDLDICVVGRTGAAVAGTFHLYKNTNGIFTDQIIIMPPYYWSAMDWGDYDNDGDLDLGITGLNTATSTTEAKIYRNDYGVLISSGINLVDAGWHGTINWVDTDNDGDLDISLLGALNNSSTYINYLYVNTGGIFSQINTGLPVGGFQSSDWSDFDGDGDADLLLSVSTNTIGVYRNIGNNNFSMVNMNNVPQTYSNVTWGDYDGDGDPDFVCRDASSTYHIYQNTGGSNIFTTNLPPATQSPASINVSGNSIIFNWPQGNDAQSTSNSLSYNTWISKISDTLFTESPMADTSSGRRMLWQLGNCGHVTHQRIYNLDSGNYVIHVQSLDIQHLGSAFSGPTFFTITSPLAPSLILPLDSSQTSTSVSFQWATFPSAIKYNLQLAFSNSFAVPIINDSTITSTVQLINVLPSDTTLYWRIRTWNGSSWSPWSVCWQFNTYNLYTAPFSTPPLCPYANSTFNIGYSSSATLFNGNIVTVELSDASGNFASSIIVGSLSTTTASGSIPISIPAGLPTGNFYRLRTVSSLPALIGSDNGNNLTIYPSMATVAISTSNPIFCFSSQDTLSAIGAGYSSLLWSNAFTTAQILVTNSGSYSVKAFDLNGCYAEDTVNVIAVSCSNVWPGDANEDLSVTTSDLLPIGVYYGLNGYPRDSVSILWMGNEALDWNTIQSNGINTKFADCNGDGTIIANDTNAIVANFNNTHVPRIVHPDYTQLITPVYLSSLSNLYAPGDQVSVYVNVGTNVSPATHVYGGNIQVSLPSSVIIPGSAERSYIPSWLGTVNTDLLALSQFGPQQQIFNFALTRFDHTNRNGYGPVAAISFVLDSTLGQGDSLIISIDNAFIIDSNGIRSNLSVSDFVIHIDTTASAIFSPSLSNESVTIYPNPFNSSLSINVISAEQTNLSINWIDITGRKIGEPQPVNLEYGMNQFNTKIPEDIESGIYFLQMVCKNSILLVKVVKL